MKKKRPSDAAVLRWLIGFKAIHDREEAAKAEQRRKRAAIAQAKLLAPPLGIEPT